MCGTLSLAGFDNLSPHSLGRCADEVNNRGVRPIHIISRLQAEQFSEQKPQRSLVAAPFGRRLSLPYDGRMNKSQGRTGAVLHSEKQLSGWKKDQIVVHWRFMDDSSVVGTLQWYDRYNVAIDAEGLGPLTIPKHALKFYGPANQLESRPSQSATHE